MARTKLDHADEDLDEHILRLIEMKGGSRDADLLKDLIATALGFIDDGTTRGELKIANSALHEMRDSFRVFAPYAAVRKVSVFGSARTHPQAPEFRLAEDVGRRLAEAGFMVITGAGPGIMHAANHGAGREMSFGCLIRLPFEPNPNEVILADRKLVAYKYFFTRKLTFVKESDGLVLFPGGFGTLDECFEVLTLIQTGKSDLLPLVFIDIPGGGYWQSFHRHFEEQLLARGLVSPEDRHLYFVTEDPAAAVAEIARFYRNYHSIRYVRELTVLRHLEPVSDDLLATLNRDFGDLLVGGEIERSAPLPDEANEPEIAHLHRLVLRFNRRCFGRLRVLVNQLNAAAPG